MPFIVFALTVFALGLAGGMVGELIQFEHSRRQEQPFSYNRAAVNALVAGIVTLIYFCFIDPVRAGYLMFVHYGVFIALLMEETIISARSTVAEKEGHVWRARQAAVAPTVPVLILNGFWQVYGAGTFGAFLSELYMLYQDRRKRRKQYTPSEWVVTTLMVLASGVITALYGVVNVSALLAVQIGASTPLIISRFRR